VPAPAGPGRAYYHTALPATNEADAVSVESLSKPYGRLATLPLMPMSGHRVCSSHQLPPSVQTRALLTIMKAEEPQIPDERDLLKISLNTETLMPPLVLICCGLSDLNIRSAEPGKPNTLHLRHSPG
jgi:hypothetical protein